MKFTWDEKKNQINLATHRIDFATASTVFHDPKLRIEHSRIDGREDRWQAIGTIDGRWVILVAHVYRVDDGELMVHIFSARQASRKERKRYKETL